MSDTTSFKDPACVFDWVMVYGPTAVGKTEIAVQLAQRLNGIMINADMGQMYQPLSCGTAKPHLETLPIEHRLFDLIAHPSSMTVARYRSMVGQVLDEAQKKARIGIVTGGSGFYLSSLFFPPVGNPGSSLPSMDADQTVGKDQWNELYRIDPVRAAHIHPHDTYRINRALEVWHTTGTLPSALEPVYAPLPGKSALIILTRSRQELYQRINERTKQMLNSGWIDEVTQLSDEWHTYLLEKKLLGYDDIVRFVSQGDTSIHDLELLIAQKTRRYAKRQISFGNFLARRLRAADTSFTVIEMNISALSLDNVVTYLEGTLRCT